MAFRVGQKVVYPNHGVTVVEKIEAGEIDGHEQTYYHLRFMSNDSKVMVPKANLDLVGLRPLCQTGEINTLFRTLRDGNIDTYKDWKGRYKQNLDKMKTGEIIEVAQVLKNLRLVSTKKSLSFREKKMYERARYFIVNEVVRHELEAFGVDLVGERLGLGHGRAHLPGALLELPADAVGLDGLLVAVPGHALDADDGDVPPEAAEAFDQGCRYPGRCR